MVWRIEIRVRAVRLQHIQALCFRADVYQRSLDRFRKADARGLILRCRDSGKSERVLLRISPDNNTHDLSLIENPNAFGLSGADIVFIMCITGINICYGGYG